MNPLQQLVSSVGMITSLLGMGAGAVNQVHMAQRSFSTPTPGIVQQCPPGTTPSTMLDAQGRRVQICIKDVR